MSIFLVSSCESCEREITGILFTMYILKASTGPSQGKSLVYVYLYGTIFNNLNHRLAHGVQKDTWTLSAAFCIRAK